MPTVSECIDLAREELQKRSKDMREDSEYYEACRVISRGSAVIPPEFRNQVASVGYSRLYLDALTARTKIDGFRTPDTPEFDDRLMDWWNINDLEQESVVSFLETLIHGRSYISVSAPTDEDALYGHPMDVPLIRIESPRHMWADIDPRTRRVNWAVRFYRDPSSRDATDEDQQYTVYLPDRTVILVDNRRGDYTTVDEIVHDLGIVPIVPSMNRERAGDRYGRSEIIPELRTVQDAATRIMLNMQTAADLMAVPQRLLFGVEKEAITSNIGDAAAQYKAYMAGILAFENENGKATQFTAAELSNYTGALQELARNAASYTGLPPQYLSFNSQNPASADAIRASEARLVKTCELKGSMFGKIWTQVMRVGALVIDGKVPEQYNRLQAILADPSTPTYAAKADAAMKLVAGKPIIPVEQARIDMGYTPEERAQMKEWDEQETAEYAASLLGVPSARFPLTTSSNSNENDSSPDTENQ